MQQIAVHLVGQEEIPPTGPKLLSEAARRSLIGTEDRSRKIMGMRYVYLTSVYTYICYTMPRVKYVYESEAYPAFSLISV